MPITQQRSISDHVNNLKIEAAMLESNIPTAAKFMPGVGDAIEFHRKVLDTLHMIAEKLES